MQYPAPPASGISVAMGIVYGQLQAYVRRHPRANCSSRGVELQNCRHKLYSGPRGKTHLFKADVNQPDKLAISLA